MPGPMTPNSPYPPEYMAMLAQMSDFGAQEQAIAQQQAMADQLRKSGAQGLGKYSQASRALAGIGGALGNLGAGMQQRKLGDARTEYLQKKLPQILGYGQPQPNVVPPTLTDEQTSGFGGVPQ